MRGSQFTFSATTFVKILETAVGSKRTQQHLALLPGCNTRSALCGVKWTNQPASPAQCAKRSPATNQGLDAAAVTAPEGRCRELSSRQARCRPAASFVVGAIDKSRRQPMTKGVNDGADRETLTRRGFERMIATVTILVDILEVGVCAKRQQATNQLPAKRVRNGS